MVDTSLERCSHVVVSTASLSLLANRSIAPIYFIFLEGKKRKHNAFPLQYTMGKSDLQSLKHAISSHLLMRNDTLHTNSHTHI